MKVGGRDFNKSKREVELAMRGQTPESIQKYFVKVNGTAYPPKQVLAHVTGWERQSFTTMEAQRVLNKLGFVCRSTERLPGSFADLISSTSEELTPKRSDEDRISALEAALATAQEAIAGLAVRVRTLEEGR